MSTITTAYALDAIVYVRKPSNDSVLRGVVSSVRVDDTGVSYDVTTQDSPSDLIYPESAVFAGPAAAFGV